MKNMKPKNIIALTSAILLTSAIPFFESASAEGLSENCLKAYLGNPMPKTLISGIGYPVADVTIDSWVKNNNYKKINQHSWDIWAALTETVNDEDLGTVPRYETWKTPLQVSSNCPPEAPITLKHPSQFTHAGISPSSNSESEAVNQVALEGVRYSPSSVRHVAKYDLLNLVALAEFYNTQKAQGVFPIQIPDFPAAAVNLKPMYKLFRKDDVANNYLPFKVWTGLPAAIPLMTVSTTVSLKVSTSVSPAGYPESSWPDCVYIDFTNKNHSKHQKERYEKCGSTTIGKHNPSSTYNISDFIHIKISDKTLDDYRHYTSEELELGDYLVLVAMHVTTREITRWTWQTFFWTYNPTDPPLPSTKAKAIAQPKGLPRGGSHYAMANGYRTNKYPISNGEAGYEMVWPAQPDLGGKSEGQGVVVFNPYLEATFGILSSTSISIVSDEGKNYMAKVGIQSNCMSCHGMASLPFGKNPGNPGYVANYYYSLDDPIFEGNLKLDFAWSIEAESK